MRHTAHTTRGFTLIETVVVIAIIAILATIAVPRMIGNDKREFNLMIEATADLLTMYAQRDMLSQQPVGIMLDLEARQLALMKLDSDPDEPDLGAFWQTDRSVYPIEIPEFVELQDIVVMADGSPVDVTLWPLSSMPGEDRPTLSISVSYRDLTRTVTLPPYALSPYDSLETQGRDPTLREPLDLDRAGLTREDW